MYTYEPLNRNNSDDVYYQINNGESETDTKKYIRRVIVIRQKDSKTSGLQLKLIFEEETNKKRIDFGKMLIVENDDILEKNEHLKKELNNLGFESYYDFYKTYLKLCEKHNLSNPSVKNKFVL